MWLKTIWINLTSPTLLLEYNGNIVIYPSLKISGEKQKICVLSLKKYLKIFESFCSVTSKGFYSEVAVCYRVSLKDSPLF